MCDSNAAADSTLESKAVYGWLITQVLVLRISVTNRTGVHHIGLAPTKSAVSCASF